MLAFLVFCFCVHIHVIYIKQISFGILLAYLLIIAFIVFQINEIRKDVKSLINSENEQVQNQESNKKRKQQIK